MGDITKYSGDAIVNAANKSLRGGGGVDGAIHRAAGPQLLDACKKLDGCSEGEAKITSGFNLEARMIIHTVGPVWGGGDNGERAVLTSCYRSCLKLATNHGLKTLAFPAISCGAYGYPSREAAEIAIVTVANYLQDHAIPREVTFICFDKSIFESIKIAFRMRI